jgi:hypothetical protein
MNVATQQRNRVATMAKTKPREALELARSIDDPWFRCQALSIAAVHTPDARSRKSALDDAFAAANRLGGANRVVTVSSWPVKALALAGQMSTVSSEVARLLRLISVESSPVRRADALRYLLGSVSIAPADVAGRVAREFAAACLAPLQSGKRNSKGESNLEACLPGIARIDPALAHRLLRRLTPSRSERAARALQAAKDVPVTPFAIRLQCADGTRWLRTGIQKMRTLSSCSPGACNVARSE